MNTVGKITGKLGFTDSRVKAVTHCAEFADPLTIISQKSGKAKTLNLKVNASAIPLARPVIPTKAFTH